MAQRKRVISGLTVADSNGLCGVIREYLAVKGAQGITQRIDQGNNFPVLDFRYPDRPTAVSFVVRPDRDEDATLKILAGNLGHKFTPKWRELRS